MSSSRLNRGHVYVDRIAPEDSGLTVLEHHVRRHVHADAPAWRARLEAGRVVVNGAPASADTVVRGGDVVEYHRPPWEEPAVDPASVRVVFEDEHVLAVDKPAGLQVLPAGSRLEATLLAVIRAGGPARASWAPAHRLGRGTSGLLVGGTTAAARESLAAQFRERRVGKLYLAGVAGCDLPDSWRATQPIGPVDHSRGSVHAASAPGKPSRTLLRAVRRDRDLGETLVAAVPVTGRPDQIRIHLAASGCPIVGDPLFGRGGALMDARPGDGGYLLHATRLRFRHPATGETVRLRCPAPWPDPHLTEPAEGVC